MILQLLNKKFLRVFIICVMGLFFSNDISWADSLEEDKSLTESTISRNDQEGIVSEKEIINSVLLHYPKILSFYESINSANNEILERQGFFDIKLKSSLGNRSRGYYDGKVSDTRISRANGFFGSEVFIGHRKSSGGFPIYEDQNITNGSSEYYAGIKFSLLRNNSIDDPRLKLLLSRLDLEKNKMQLQSIKNKIVEDALSYYWKWVISSNRYHLYKELYELALKRQEKMAILFKKGDISRILLIENERNILNRKRKLIDSKRIFENNSILISLFLRDKNGKPIQPDNSRIFKVDPEEEIKYSQDVRLNRDIDFALENRPDIKIIKLKARKERQKIKQAKNLNKPKFDISIKTAKDYGNGANSRGESENIINAELEIPFQRRMAKGKIGKYKARLKGIAYKQQLMLEKIRVEIKRFDNSINHSIDIHKNIKKEIDLSNILRKSELIKFKRGHSDFFLINLREQELFNARLDLLYIYEKYQNFVIKYKAATFKLIEF